MSTGPPGDAGCGKGAAGCCGGDGNDIYYVDSFGDVVNEDTRDAIGGTDLVFAYVATTLSFGVENLTIIGSGAVNGHGNELANVIQGASGQNELYGNAGNDKLSGLDGNDVLSGGEGKDRLLGGAGSDFLFGGKGADVFEFDLVSDSPVRAAVRDVCRSDGIAPAFAGAGVAGGDLIDLSGIDANVNAIGNQAFVFGGGGIGRVSVVASGTDSLVHCNVDGDAAFEFELAIEDGGVLASAYKALDFVL